MIRNIAIDGPAGAGKSTIARKVAERLGFLYVDTGALYRAIALYLIRNQVDEKDEKAIAQAVEGIQVTLSHVEGEQRVFLNGEDVTPYLREEEVSRMSSVAAANPAVRARLLSLQQDLGRTKSVVMDGRDIGTAVLPGADVKIYLTASIEARAKRRFLELPDGDPEEIKQEIRVRDERDKTREISPLRMAEDAVLVDTSDLTIEEVTERVLEIYYEKTGEIRP